MYSRDYDREKSPYLVLSASLHIILLLAFIHLRWNSTEHQPAIQQEKKQKDEQKKSLDKLPPLPPLQQERVAALKPRASQFGAPVIFQEEPAFTPKDTDTQEDSSISIPEEPQTPLTADEPSYIDQEEPTTESATQDTRADQKQAQENLLQAAEKTAHKELLEKAPEVEKNIKPQKTELNKDTSTALRTESETTKNQSPLSNTNEQKPDKKITSEEGVIPEKELTIQQTVIAAATAQREKQAQQRRRRRPLQHPSQKSRDQSGNQKEDAAPITKQITFADLAKGFIQTIKNEGQDLLEREGDESIRPDLEEMKVLSYKQKVVWFIQNAFRIRSDEEPPHPEAIVKCYTLMTLDGDGNIISVQLVYSTGVTLFDKYYLDVLKSAAPFPPIPQHIKKPFVFPFTMVYYTRGAQAAAKVRRQPRLGFNFS